MVVGSCILLVVLLHAGDESVQVVQSQLCLFDVPGVDDAGLQQGIDRFQVLGEVSFTLVVGFDESLVGLDELTLLLDDEHCAVDGCGLGGHGVSFYVCLILFCMNFKKAY